MDILAYAAQRFFVHARTICSPQEEQEAFNYAASLLRKSVFVASGLIPDEARSIEVCTSVLQAIDKSKTFLRLDRYFSHMPSRYVSVTQAGLLIAAGSKPGRRQRLSR